MDHSGGGCWKQRLLVRLMMSLRRAMLSLLRLRSTSSFRRFSAPSSCRLRYPLTSSSTLTNGCRNSAAIAAARSMLLKTAVARRRVGSNWRETSWPQGARAAASIFCVKESPRCQRTTTALICQQYCCGVISWLICLRSRSRSSSSRSFFSKNSFLRLAYACRSSLARRCSSSRRLSCSMRVLRSASMLAMRWRCSSRARMWSAYRRRLDSSSRNSQALLILMNCSVASSSLLRSGWYLRASVRQFFLRTAKSASGAVPRISQGSPPSRSTTCLRVSILQERLYSERIIEQMALSEWYNGFRQYLWPAGEQGREQSEEGEEQMGRLARLRRLEGLLQQSSYSSVEQQQIVRFYGALIDQYPHARCSKLHPSFLHEPQVYTPLLHFSLLLKVQTQQLSCQLELVIVFPLKLAANLPLFFIRNPDFSKYKPRERFVRFGREQLESHQFEAVMGGVRVVMAEQAGERWDWGAQSYYQEENVVNMVRWVHRQLLLDCFPFAKRKTPLSTEIYAKARELRQFIDDNILLPHRESQLQEIPLLEGIQNANSLSVSIQAEVDVLRQEISEMKDFIARSEHFAIEQFMPEPRDKKSETILDALSTIDACKDVESELEKQFLRANFDLGAFKSGIEEMCDKKFDAYYRLSYWKSPELLW